MKTTIAFVVSLILISACSSPTGPEYGFLELTVLDEINNPVKDAIITLRDDIEPDLTDSEGKAEFAELEPGEYSVTVESEFAPTIIRSLTIAPNDTLRFTINLTRDQGTLEVEVLEEWAQIPVVNATVQISRNYDRVIVFESSTDVSGKIYPPSLPAGILSVV